MKIVQQIIHLETTLNHHNLSSLFNYFTFVVALFFQDW